MIVNDLMAQAEVAAYEQALVNNDVAARALAVGRKLEQTRVATSGRDLAVAATLFRSDHAPGKIRRQMQAWVRFPEGWRIVAAHLSVIDGAQGKPALE
jgi:1-carboxybiuret hydrolase subunit AtzH-like protein